MASPPFEFQSSRSDRVFEEQLAITMKNTKGILILAVSVILLIAANGFEEIERFDNFKVYNLFVEDDGQDVIVRQLLKEYDARIMQDGVQNISPYYVAVEPEKQKSFEKDLLELKVLHDLLNENLQDLLDKRSEGHSKKVSNETMDWKKYHSLETINSWLFKIARENRRFVKKRIIGFSAHLRPIYALHLSKRPHNKAIFIESNIHAIEWLSSAVSTCFLNHLINTKSQLLEKYDWIFVPILNPDGFYYTKTKNPLWRKNRRFLGFYNSSGLCFGVDMNRNYNNHWGDSGYNLDDPCDHFYAGKHPESEPEVKAAVRFEKSFKKGYIRIHLALHTYGQLLLLPYGHNTTEVPPNYDQMMTISAAFARAAKQKYGTQYLHGTSGRLLGFVSGASKDFWYEQGIKYSATLELRDRGKYGFFVPGSQIQPTCDEVIDGLYALVDEAQKSGIFD